MGSRHAADYRQLAIWWFSVFIQTEHDHDEGGASTADKNEAEKLGLIAFMAMARANRVLFQAQEHLTDVARKSASSVAPL